MANREGTILSDEAMMAMCYEGKPVPMGRLDLLLPPPQNTSGVYYRPTKTIPMMMRPDTVASQIHNLSSISKMPSESLYASYAESLRDMKKMPSLDLAKAHRAGRTPQVYTPDITDAIFETLFNAQVYEATGFTQVYPVPGLEAMEGFASGLPSEKEQRRTELTRQIKESAVGRPAIAQLKGRGRPPEFTLPSITITGTSSAGPSGPSGP